MRIYLYNPANLKRHFYEFPHDHSGLLEYK
jgi:hypothetical protein